MKEVLVWTDGGAINNPGRAAIGVVLKFDDQIKEYSKEIGVLTNNQAEYYAVIFALEKIKKLLGKNKTKNIKVIIHLDSELVGYQLKNKYKVLEKDLIPYFIKFHNLSLDFGEIEIKIIPREENIRTDKLVKNILHNFSTII